MKLGDTLNFSLKCQYWKNKYKLSGRPGNLILSHQVTGPANFSFSAEKKGVSQRGALSDSASFTIDPFLPASQGQAGRIKFCSQVELQLHK